MVYGLVLYLLSNVALYLVDEKLFSSSYFYAPLVIFDTLFITVSMTLSGQISTDLYLSYFLTIVLCSLCRDFRGLITLALLAPLVYGYFLFTATEISDPSVYLRLPLPFVIALFYGYFAQLENFERSLKEKAEQEAKNMAMVHSLSQSLTASSDYQQILALLREEIGQAVPAAKVYLFILNEAGGLSGGELFDIKEKGLKPRSVSLQDIPVVEQCLATGKPVFKRCAEGNLLTSTRQEDSLDLYFPGVMAVPIVFRGENYGAILLGFDRADHLLGSRENEYGKIVAFATAISLSHAKREERIERHLQRISALHEINLATTSTLELRAVLEILLEKMAANLPYATVTTVRIINRETGILEAAAFRNITENEWRKGIPQGGRGLSKAVLENKTPVMVVNALKDPRARYPDFFRRHGLVSFLGVPLIAKGEVLGDISIFTKAEQLFTPEEIKFFSALAGQAAIAIYHARLFEDIKRQAVELDNANSVKSEFLSVMSHELRTPLNAVMGYTGMIQDGMLGEITTGQKTAVEKVLRHSNDLLSMISSILEVTTLEAQMVKAEVAEIQISDFLDELKLAYDVLPDRDLTMIWNYPAGLPVVKTDRKKLHHILKNLIDNAVKFTKSGSVTISAWDFPYPRRVEFKVADTGIGIPESALPFIFEKFRQADSSETRNYGGVGLGLYIVKNFAELLGARIEVDSEPNKGSIFTLTLPY